MEKCNCLDCVQKAKNFFIKELKYKKEEVEKIDIDTILNTYFAVKGISFNVHKTACFENPNAMIID